MALPAVFPALAGAEYSVSLALRSRTQGKLIDAAYWAATAAQAAGSVFFEANALAAALAGEAGHIEAAIAFWDKIIRSAPQKLVWLEAAIKFACSRPDVQKLRDALCRWQKLLAHVFIASPSVPILVLLTTRGYPLTGSLGIHAGNLKGWLWLEKDKRASLVCEGVKGYSVSLYPKVVSQTHILYEINQTLPEQVCLIAVNGPDGSQISGSPAICWPPKATLKTAKSVARQVTVLVPVYDDADATLTSLGSVFASRKFNKTQFRILVAWDNGPDANLLKRLRRLADVKKIELLENSRNLGFLASVNNAVSHISYGDVILLNADTIVHGDWVDRLRNAAAMPHAATVTALSNEAELLSYPSAQDRGKVANLRQTAILDRAAALLSTTDATMEIPVGVGFCMYITRQALNKIGMLDGTFLFRGYGEEVDFCLRASEAGLVNYGAFNVFVAHMGERSFGTAKRALAAQNNVAIFERFPDYRLAYEMFCQRQRPKELRRKLALATLADIETLPFLELRPWSERYLPPWAKDERYKPDKRGAALFLKPGRHPRALLRVWAELPVMEMEFELPTQKDDLAAALDDIKYARAYANDLPESVITLAKGLNITFDLLKNDVALPLWQEHEQRLLVVPPAHFAALRKLFSLAQKLPENIFYVFHIDSLWKNVPRPVNILEIPQLDDYRLLQPEALLILDNFFDVAAWQAWICAHDCPDLPVYTSR